jgi:hypothetical protein
MSCKLRPERRRKGGGGVMKIKIKLEDLPKKRSGLTVAMFRRHPRRQTLRDRRLRRAKDVRKHWSKEWE